MRSEPAVFALASTAGRIAGALVAEGATAAVVRRNIVRGEMRGYSVRYLTGGYNAFVTEADVERINEKTTSN